MSDTEPTPTSFPEATSKPGELSTNKPRPSWADKISPTVGRRDLAPEIFVTDGFSDLKGDPVSYLEKRTLEKGKPNFNPREEQSADLVSFTFVADALLDTPDPALGPSVDGKPKTYREAMSEFLSTKIETDPITGQEKEKKMSPQDEIKLTLLRRQFYEKVEGALMARNNSVELKDKVMSEMRIKLKALEVELQRSIDDNSGQKRDELVAKYNGVLKKDAKAPQNKEETRTEGRIKEVLKSRSAAEVFDMAFKGGNLMKRRTLDEGGSPEKKPDATPKLDREPVGLPARPVPAATQTAPAASEVVPTQEPEFTQEKFFNEREIIGVGVLEDRMVREGLENAAHLRASTEKKGFLKRIIDFPRWAWQNNLNRTAISVRDTRFALESSFIAKKALGLDDSVPFKLSQDELVHILEMGQQRGAIDNGHGGKLRRNIVRNAWSGTTGIGLTSQQRKAKAWLNNVDGRKYLREELINKNLREQTAIGERYSIVAEKSPDFERSVRFANAFILSKEMGEKRQILELNNQEFGDLQVGVKKLISEYAGDPFEGDDKWKSDRQLELISAFNQELKRVLGESPKYRELVTQTELASNIAVLAEKAKVAFKTDKAEAAKQLSATNITLLAGSAQEGAARGGVESLGGRLQFNPVEYFARRFAKRSYGLGDKLLVGSVNTLKDLGLYVGAYAGAYVAGGAISGAYAARGAMLVPSPLTIALSGISSGIVNAIKEGGLTQEARGKISGMFGGRTYNDFAQYSFEKAQGRENPERAKIRKEMDTATVDSRKYEDLVSPIEELVTKQEPLTAEDRKTLAMHLADIKSRLTLTDLTVSRNKNDRSKIRIPQNFIQYEQGSENRQMFELRSILLNGTSRLVTEGGTEEKARLAKLNAIIMAELTMGQAQDGRIMLEVRHELTKSGITIANSDLMALRSQVCSELEIDSSRSLENSMKLLAKLNRRKSGGVGLVTASVGTALGFAFGEGLALGKEAIDNLSQNAFGMNVAGVGSHAWNALWNGNPDAVKDIVTSAQNPLTDWEHAIYDWDSMTSEEISHLTLLQKGVVRAAELARDVQPVERVQKLGENIQDSIAHFTQPDGSDIYTVIDHRDSTEIVIGQTNLSELKSASMGDRLTRIPLHTYWNNITNADGIATHHRLMFDNNTPNGFGDDVDLGVDVYVDNSGRFVTEYDHLATKLVDITGQGDDIRQISFDAPLTRGDLGMPTEIIKTLMVDPKAIAMVPSSPDLPPIGDVKLSTNVDFSWNDAKPPFVVPIWGRYNIERSLKPGTKGESQAAQVATTSPAPSTQTPLPAEVARPSPSNEAAAPQPATAPVQTAESGANIVDIDPRNYDPSTIQVTPEKAKLILTRNEVELKNEYLEGLKLIKKKQNETDGEYEKRLESIDPDFIAQMKDNNFQISEENCLRIYNDGWLKVIARKMFTSELPQKILILLTTFDQNIQNNDITEVQFSPYKARMRQAVTDDEKLAIWKEYQSQVPVQINFEQYLLDERISKALNLSIAKTLEPESQVRKIILTKFIEWRSEARDSSAPASQTNVS